MLTSKISIWPERNWQISQIKVQRSALMCLQINTTTEVIISHQLADKDKQNVQTGYETEWLVQMDACVLHRSTAKRRAPALDNENRLCSPEHNEGGELTWEWHVAIILRGCLSPRQLTGCADTVGHGGLLVPRYPTWLLIQCRALMEIGVMDRLQVSTSLGLMLV